VSAKGFSPSERIRKGKAGGAFPFFVFAGFPGKLEEKRDRSRTEDTTV